ncbi:MAG: hypothetical protein ACRBN8_01310 [Nannocystales bacterium]
MTALVLSGTSCRMPNPAFDGLAADSAGDTTGGVDSDDPTDSDTSLSPSGTTRSEDGMTASNTTSVDVTTESGNTSPSTTTTTTTTTTDGDTTDTTGAPECGALIYEVAGPETGHMNIGLETTRAGEEVRAGSLLEGEPIRCWSVWLSRADADATGDIDVVIRRVTDDAVVATFEGIGSATELSETTSLYTFTLAAPHTLEPDDRLLVEYAGPSSIHLGWVDEGFDGALTRRVRFEMNAYQFGSARDIIGTMAAP